MRDFATVRHLLASSTALSAIALSFCAPAAAQDALPSPQSPTSGAQASQEGAAETRDVVVTGSRIVRDGFQSPTPVTVLSEEEIQNTSPTNNIANLMDQMPVIAGSFTPDSALIDFSSGTAGVYALNLRNLGPGRTLVLLDGRRTVSSTVSGFTDINTIPQGLVRRVETVTGGASAAYGSDAVAGVVNFIMNKKYTGVKITADTGITTYGDGFNYSGSFTAGTSFAGGRGHVMVDADFRHNDGIFEITRKWNQLGYAAIQDPNWTATSTTPQFLVRRQVGATQLLPGSLVGSSTGGGTNKLRGIYFGPGGELLRYNYGDLTFPAVSGTPVPQFTQGGDWQLADNWRRRGLSPDDDRYGAFGRVSFEVANDFTLFAEASYNVYKGHYVSAPQQINNITINVTGCGAAVTRETAPVTCNAFAYNAFGRELLNGVTSINVGSTQGDLPLRQMKNEREVQRYLIGAEGRFEAFGKPAQWDISAQYGRSDVRSQLINIMHNSRISRARTAAFARAGNPGGYAVGSIQCQVNVDTNLTNDDPSCVPFNILGTGVNSNLDAVVGYVLGNPYRLEVLEQKAASANLSLTPFRTWAGDVSIAIGGEWREEQISGFVPAEFQPVVTATGTTNAWSVGNYQPTTGRYNVKEGYFETVVPLLSGLEVNGAVRATDYSSAGYVTTWKAGGTWQPIPDFRVRVTRSRDIRAPNLNELYQEGTAGSDTVANPAYTPDGANGPARIGYSQLTVGNPNLVVETADQWNVGAVFQPRFLPGVQGSIDYYRINLQGRISSLGPQSMVDLCHLGNQDICQSITVDPSRSSPGVPYYQILLRPFNAEMQDLRGIDFELLYRLRLRDVFDNGRGNLTLRGFATRYIQNLVISGIPEALDRNTVGVNGSRAGTPTWRFRASATYDNPDLSVSLVARGVSAGVFRETAIECQTNCPLSTTNAPTYDNNRVSGIFYTDLNVTKKFKMGRSRTEMFLNVTNLFDRWPMLVPAGGYGANPVYSDVRGRSFRFGVRFHTK
ncbi:TonB-dependent receptor plug domain-containing protein [Sphingomonas sp.]|uniref:TonB-dependent receptor plug domain-containing protein n=1 Tax=Sphingomonas sp. TaxID=28214 RepID=UPI002DD68682|nr:TonB-dependent receptor [Sphingomonas sp.]